MPGTMVVQYSDHHLVNRLVFRPFEYRSAIQMPCTIVPCIWLANQLNIGQVKVCFSDVSAIQMFLLFRSPTETCKMLFVSILKLGYNRAIDCLFISDNQQKMGRLIGIWIENVLNWVVGRPEWSLLNDVTWIPFLLSYFTCTYRFSSVPYQTSLFIMVLYISAPC